MAADRSPREGGRSAKAAAWVDTVAVWTSLAREAEELVGECWGTVARGGIERPRERFSKCSEHILSVKHDAHARVLYIDRIPSLEVTKPKHKRPENG